MTEPPSDLRDLIDRWELVGCKQRELSQDKQLPPEVRAGLVSASNAWMTAADDLRKAITKMENR